jgi:hypothetical protein
MRFYYGYIAGCCSTCVITVALAQLSWLPIVFALIGAAGIGCAIFGNIEMVQIEDDPAPGETGHDPLKEGE